MHIGVIGTGNIGTTIGQALHRAGHAVVFGSRHPADEPVGRVGAEGAVGTVEAVGGPSVADVASAIEGADVVVVAIPGPAVESFAADHGARLTGTLVLDASNKMGGPVANAREALAAGAPGARYARVFNCVGVEILEDPVFQGVAADMYFACLDADRAEVEGLVADVGLHPVFVGDDPDLVDGVFRLWVALAMGQGRGRQFAFSTLER